MKPSNACSESTGNHIWEGLKIKIKIQYAYEWAYIDLEWAFVSEHIQCGGIWMSVNSTRVQIISV